jgi:hypothetical protein
MWREEDSVSDQVRPSRRSGTRLQSILLALVDQLEASGVINPDDLDRGVSRHEAEKDKRDENYWRERKERPIWKRLFG